MFIASLHTCMNEWMDAGWYQYQQIIMKIKQRQIIQICNGIGNKLKLTNTNYSTYIRFESILDQASAQSDKF